jgi:hypothetical protein
MCTKYSAGPKAAFLQWEFISDLKDFDPSPVQELLALWLLSVS